MPAVRTPSDLGLALRSGRRALNLNQATLARRIGVSRQWVIDIEKGKPRAELELVMRALHAVGLTVVVEGPRAPNPASREDAEPLATANEIVRRFDAARETQRDSPLPILKRLAVSRRRDK
jgi:y4mF family transcriptional regulator